MFLLKRFFKMLKKYLLSGWNRLCSEHVWQVGGIFFAVVLAFCFGTFGFAQIVRSSELLSSKINLGESWYGEEYEVHPAASEDDEVWGNVVLELEDFSTLPEARILINGVEASNFSEKQVTLRVENGDVIAVDASAYNSPFKVRIKSVSSVIDVRELREMSIIDEDYQTIGKIIFK